MLRMEIFIICSFIYLPVYAETTATINFSAKIEKGCAFKESSVSLDFGSHPTSSQETNVSASILNDAASWKLECTPDIPVTIVVGNGMSFDNTTQSRRLKNSESNHFINYKIYFDLGRSKEIGSVHPYNSGNLKSTTSNNILNFGIYGLVDLSKGELNKPSGKYSDEVVITIYW